MVHQAEILLFPQKALAKGRAIKKRKQRYREMILRVVQKF